MLSNGSVFLSFHLMKTERHSRRSFQAPFYSRVLKTRCEFVICLLSELRCTFWVSSKISLLAMASRRSYNNFYDLNQSGLMCMRYDRVHSIFEVIQVTPRRRRLKAQRCPRVCQSAWVIFNQWPCNRSRAVPTALSLETMLSPNTVGGCTTLWRDIFHRLNIFIKGIKRMERRRAKQGNR